MITAGLTFSRPDGSVATVQPNRFSGWNLLLDTDNVITGLTDFEVEQQMTAYRAAQARAANAATAALAMLALEINDAHTAALRENEKRDAKAARDRARRAKFIPGTDVLRYRDLETGPDATYIELILWSEEVYTGICAGVKDIPRFAGNYTDAGHTYVDGMPGLHDCTDSNALYDSFTVQLGNRQIPENMLVAIAALQNKFGIREGQPTLPVNCKKGINCNALAWTLIRRGATVGPRR
jgi:hypothetical protein